MISWSCCGVDIISDCETTLRLPLVTAVAVAPRTGVGAGVGVVTSAVVLAMDPAVV